MRSPAAALGLGFRPFYLLAGTFAVGSIAFWLVSLAGALQGGAYLRGIFWHSHEMVFGYAVAVMAGFLLTAVKNWTGLPTPTGARLAALAAVWLGGRVMVLSGPPLAAAIVDLMFVPLLAIAIAVPIIASRNRRNYKIVALLALIALANVVYHLAALGPLPAWLAYTSIVSAMDLMTVIYAIVAGRVIPAFTRNAVSTSQPQQRDWLEFVTFATFGLIIAVRLWSDWVPLSPLLITVLCVIAALSHFLRLALWQPQATLGNTLLWMLPVAYSWLPVTFALRALAQYAIVTPGTWIHALMMGAISSLMLAMMMRSTLGHTGRPLLASGIDMSAFLMLQVAALLRVGAMLFPGPHYTTVVSVSGGLWIAAFALFLMRYVPMLIGPRIDGKAG